MNIKISIIMPVHNAEATVGIAIESVLEQTFTDYEFIIIDDGSTDKTPMIIRQYEDRRIQIITKEQNYIQSLNIGLKLARGKYIARMDADDIMLPDRLRVQYAIMEEFPQITVCSSLVYLMGKDIPKGLISQSVTGLIKRPLWLLLHHNFISHPASIIRKSFIRKHRLTYQQDYIYAEDYALWTDIILHGGLFFIEPQPLIYYRLSENQLTHKYRQEQLEASKKVQQKILHSLISAIEDGQTRSLLLAIQSDIIHAEKKGLITWEHAISLFQELLNH